MLPTGLDLHALAAAREEPPSRSGPSMGEGSGEVEPRGLLQWGRAAIHELLGGVAESGPVSTLRAHAAVAATEQGSDVGDSNTQADA